jgi:hypothetical protein
MSEMTMLRPYQRFPDRKLLKLFVASKEYAEATGSSLTSEGFMQADELTCRHYNVADIEDLRRRLEK